MGFRGQQCWWAPGPTTGPHRPGAAGLYGRPQVKDAVSGLVRHEESRSEHHQDRPDGTSVRVGRSGPGLEGGPRSAVRDPRTPAVFKRLAEK